MGTIGAVDTSGGMVGAAVAGGQGIGTGTLGCLVGAPPLHGLTSHLIPTNRTPAVPTFLPSTLNTLPTYPAHTTHTQHMDPSTDWLRGITEILWGTSFHPTVPSISLCKNPRLPFSHSPASFPKNPWRGIHPASGNAKSSEGVLFSHPPAKTKNSSEVRYYSYDASGIP